MGTNRKPDLIKKPDDMKRRRVDESIAPGLEADETEVKRLLEEPKSEHVSVDGFLCFGEENVEKHLKMEEFSYAFDYGWTIGFGQELRAKTMHPECMNLLTKRGLDSIHDQGGEDLKFEEVLDGLLDEVDEVDDIHAAHDLSNACEDFLLDVEFPGKFSELESGHEGSNLRNSSSESHSPVSSGTSNSNGSISESSIVTVEESNCKNGVLGKMATCDLHHTFRSTSGCQAPVMETVRHSIIEHVQDFVESDDEKPLVSFILSNKKVKSSVKVTKGGTLLIQKRLRKSTMRYIEEFSRNSTTSGKNKCLKVISQEEFPQVPSESQPRRGLPKKIVPKLEFESDCELSASESEDEHKRTKRSKTACDRRKHKKPWTIAEVIKLVDGIAQHGVGRWTNIKKLLFASSAYRTPVDLRDKWRNLLKSSSAHKHNRKELQVETNMKHNVRPLPKTVACRIRELASIHPYPKVRRPNLLSVDSDSSSKQPTTKTTPVNTYGRNLRRK